jgi:hypothetical protein
MKRRFLSIVLAAVLASVVLVAVQASAGDSQALTAAQIAQFTALDANLVSVLDEQTFSTASPPPLKEVKPHEFDPAKTILVQATWSGATGCPTDAKTFDGSTTSSFTDLACTSGDPKDNENDGLVLAKTGPTANFAAAVAELKGVKGITLSELGYDIRKSAAEGSHCDNGSPRFDVVTTDDVVHFVGCSSPPPAVTAASVGWLRLRWNAAALAAAFPPITPADTVKRIVLVFDDGQDNGAISFGAAVLDNIDVNGTLVGHGPDESEP